MKSGKQHQSKHSSRTPRTSKRAIFFFFQILSFALILSASGFIIFDSSSKTHAGYRKEEVIPTNNCEGVISAELKNSGKYKPG